ncbi:MAG: helix-turn-helix transcriptional regulator [Nitrosospira sp.]|nr:helix-turn-helix transcriptional regulator [Nitrosospira sp.]
MFHFARGSRLVELRRRCALTQSQLGDLCGVTRAIISQWESGVSKPELSKLIALHSKLDFSLAWLLTGFESKNGSDAMSEIKGRSLLGGP